jgi:hypothetical protein
VCTAAPAAAEWRRIDSPNFVVVGDVSARELRDLAVKFEAFRETLGRILSDRAVSTAVPTVVIVFPSGRAFAPFAPRFNGRAVEAAGLFVARPDMNYIAIVSGSGPERLQVVFHEYAHLLISNMSRRLPVWLNEGLAEFYSTFELGRGGREAVLGSPLDRHLQRLNGSQLLPLEQLLTVTHDSAMYNEGDRRSVFYGQSWALTHLLLLGQPLRTPKLLAYLDAVNGGAAPMTAWQSAFAGEDIGRELQGYLRQQAFRAIEYTFSSGLASFDAPASPMSLADAETILGEFLLHQGRADDAAARLQAVEKREPGNDRLAIALIRLELVKKNYAAAASRLQRLGAPGDWLLGYLAGIAAADLAETRTERLLPAELDAVRRFFAIARGGGSEFPNALARMSELALRSEAGPTAETRDALARARSLAPGRSEYTLLYAQALGRLGEFGAARGVLGPLLSPVVPQSVRESARSLMAYLAQLERVRAQRFAAMTGSPAPPSRDSAGTPGRESLETGHPLLRAVRPGESRIEGLLERIDCVTGTGIVLRVKTADGTVTAQAPRLDDIDFITYRDDVGGVVQCGALNAPMAVLLTWRATPGAPGTRVAVAVEFLPRKMP